jgi:CubicO group peptidase (beta-lactamase class C family)
MLPEEESPVNRSPLPCLALALLLTACAAGDAPSPASDAEIEALMEQARIPGLAVARLENGKVESTRLFGVANAETGESVTPETLFEAASLSKPVFATAVLRIVERLEFDLDHPLHSLVSDERMSHDPRFEDLTARIVLSHRTGLPNWGGETLEFSHDPGTRFGYSGEGYVYLQKVISYLTGLTLDEFVRQEVFDPLGMTHSRFSWPEGEELELAMPHDGGGKPQEKQQAHEGNAAASLHTTAEDYGRFVAAWLSGELLGSEAAAEALTPVAFMEGDDDDPPEAEEVWGRIAWALGWGVQLDALKGSEPDTQETVDPLYWHWGDNGAFKAFVAFRPGTGDGIVYFTNSSNGLAIGPTMMASVVGSMEPTFAWLDYERVDSPGFGERLEGSLAEAEGRIEDAIAAYQSAVEVDPDDETSARWVEWLGGLLEATADPVSMSEEVLTSYVGTYGPRVLTLEEGRLHYQRGEGRKHSLIPLADNLFALEGMNFFRVELVHAPSGAVEKIVGHYINGTTDESLRD